MRAGGKTSINVTGATAVAPAALAAAPHLADVQERIFDAITARSAELPELPGAAWINPPQEKEAATQ
jgi:hypothetical protein